MFNWMHTELPQYHMACGNLLRTCMPYLQDSNDGIKRLGVQLERWSKLCICGHGNDLFAQLRKREQEIFVSLYPFLLK